jgi:hypothetical protein
VAAKAKSRCDRRRGGVVIGISRSGEQAILSEENPQPIKRALSTRGESAQGQQTVSSFGRAAQISAGQLWSFRGGETRLDNNCGNSAKKRLVTRMPMFIGKKSRKKV